MAASKIITPRIHLHQCDDGTVMATYPTKTYRFLFADGETLDVEAIRDDSDLREAMLAQHYGRKVTDPKEGSIAGVAQLPQVSTPAQPVKKATSKRAPRSSPPS